MSCLLRQKSIADHAETLELNAATIKTEYRSLSATIRDESRFP
jgi:hypothetical protein